MKTYNATKFSSFREIIDRIAEKFKDKTAFQIKQSEGYREISFDTFRLHFYRLCTHLLKKDMYKKRIAVSGANCYEWVLSYLAAATVGVAVPIDKELSGEDIEEFVKAGECSAVFCDRKVAEKLSVESVSFEKVMEIVDSPMTPAFFEISKIEKKRDEMSVLIFTSGTTGSSKGVMLSQDNICSNIYQTVQIVKQFNNLNLDKLNLLISLLFGML